MKTWFSRLFSARTQPEASPSIPAESTASVQGTTTHKEAGDQFLSNGDFASAIDAYRQALAQGASSAALFCNLAFSLKETGLVDEALQTLQQALANYPDSADCHYMLGDIARQFGNPELAIAQFRAALTFAPDFEDAHRELCVTLFSQGQFGEAIDAVQTGLQHCPHSADLHFWKGNLHHQLQQHVDAIAEFDIALSISPERIDILHNLSLSLLFAKKTERAIDVLRSIAASPQSSIATLNNLAMALLESDGAAEAIGHLQRALSISPDDVSSLINISRALQQAKQPGEAIAHLQHALTIDPHSFDAAFDLAGAFAANGDSVQAHKHYRIAKALRPDATAPLISEGIAFFEDRNFDEALQSFRSAQVRAPEMAWAYVYAGNTLRELNRNADAMHQYRLALHIDASLFDAHLYLGTLLHTNLAFNEAMTCYRQALEIDPGSRLAHLNTGFLYCAMNRDEAAIPSFLEALRLAPEEASITHALALALKKSGRKEDAASAWRTALVLDPAFEPAWLNLGSLLHDSLSYDDACNAYRRALVMEPGNTETLLGQGNVLTHLQLYEEAIDCYREAIRIEPTYVKAYGNLANVLSDVGRHQEAIEIYHQALQNGPIDFRIYSNLLFARNYMPDVPTSALREEAVRYGKLVTQQAKPYDSWVNEPSPNRRLRVGLVSGDLRHHPVGFFIDSTLAALARESGSNIELIGYSNVDHDDYLTERIRAHCYAWRPIANLDDDTAARQIRSDDIDILLDLSGHSSLNRLPLFAWKPAPIQASWLGYFATTGLTAIDYFIADPWSVPPDNDNLFTETIWRLPETRFSFTAPDIAIDVSTLPALQNGFITFGCFNNLSKMTDDVVALWARILRETPDSRLFLKSIQLAGEKVRSNIMDRFAAHGITAERLQVEGFTSRADYLAAYHRVDIALDPFPYTGGATTAESLWMGVPVFTLTGENLIARQGTSLLMNAGLSDWIADSEENYFHGVLRHAGDLLQLSTLRAGMRAQVLASPLFDAKRLSTHMEAALRAMWVDWCQRQPGNAT